MKHTTVISNQVIKPPVQSSTSCLGFRGLRDARGLFILDVQRTATSSSLPAINIEISIPEYSQLWSERSFWAMVALQVSAWTAAFIDCNAPEELTPRDSEVSGLSLHT